MEHKLKLPRRNFIKTSALGFGAIALTPSVLANDHDRPIHEDDKLGVAIVGLSWYSRDHVATAFVDAKYCKLVGFVTGSPEKAKDFQKEHNISDENVYNYDTFDEIADNPNIDIVYIVLPNALHAEYTVRAAKAGKHVICEKPMEVSVEKAQEMVDACEKAGTLLQIGYRCQHDPYHREIKRLVQEKIYGEVKLIQAACGFFGVHGNNWRYTNKALAGGGAMMDVGVYCIQSARFIMDADPIAVTARTYKTYLDKLPDMEETIIWEMEFQNGAVASCVSSYAAQNDYLHVSAEKGTFGLKPAYGLSPLKGYVDGKELSFPRRRQQAVQMDAFVRNILDGTPVIASGKSGVQDLKVIEAVYKAAKTGGRVML